MAARRHRRSFLDTQALTAGICTGVFGFALMFVVLSKTGLAAQLTAPTCVCDDGAGQQEVQGDGLEQIIDSLSPDDLLQDNSLTDDTVLHESAPEAGQGETDLGNETMNVDLSTDSAVTTEGQEYELFPQPSADPAPTEEYGIIPLFTYTEECFNEIDDDGDGLADTFDSDCTLPIEYQLTSPDDLSVGEGSPLFYEPLPIVESGQGSEIFIPYIEPEPDTLMPDNAAEPMQEAPEEPAPDYTEPLPVDTNTSQDPEPILMQESAPQYFEDLTTVSPGQYEEWMAPEEQVAPSAEPTSDVTKPAEDTGLFDWLLNLFDW